MPFTSNRLVNRLAKARGYDEAQKTRAFRSIRNMVAKDVVRSTVDEDDARSPRVFGDREACVLALLLPPCELAMEVRVLREIATKLTSLTHSHGDAVLIDRALDAARAGRKADLVVRLIRLGTDPTRLDVRVRVEGEEPSTEVASILSDYDALSSEVVASLTIGVNEWLRPLFNEAED